MDKWAKMPCSWQTDRDFHARLKRHRYLTYLELEGPPGEPIAALKIYIGLCLRANFSEKPIFPATGCVRRSVSQVAELVGVSRPMAIKGLRKLQEWGIVDKRGGRPTVYHITDYETGKDKPAKYWTKLPRSPFQTGSNDNHIEVLRSMSNRSVTTLHALQMYVYLASIRSSRTALAKVTYDHLTHVLGIGRDNVSAAISALIGFNLISVRLAGPDEFYGDRPSNIYWLRGTYVNDEAPVTSPAS